MKKPSSFIIGAALIGAIAACSNQAPAGQFVLAEIEGGTPPWVYPSTNVRYDGGTLTLRDDGTFSDVIEWSDGAGAHATNEFGTWAQEGSTIRLQYAQGGTNCPFFSGGGCDAGMYEARLIAGGLLTKGRTEGVQLVYRRQ